MKNSIRILLVFLISASNSIACSWYPFGESIRFSLINPSFFDDGGMSPYHYSYFDYGYRFVPTVENDPNIELWKDYCGGKVNGESIFQAVYKLHKSQIHSVSSRNEMVQYLRKNDREALNYIAFAKSCSDLNNAYSSWERDDQDDYARNTKILDALKRSQSVKSEVIKKRYRFLAVRLAYYNGDDDKVRAIYKKSFPKDPKDVIDYWAFYFNTTTEEISAERNFKLAQIFVKAPGKRFGVLSRFSRKISKDEVLAFAQTNTERANVHLMYAVREQGRGLLTLKKVQNLDPNHPLLNYLLIREVNKLEDWVLTPRYTNFEPTLDPRRESYNESNVLIQERIEGDEAYAHELAGWIGTLDLTSNKGTWKLVEAYLLGISGHPLQANSLLSDLDEHPPNTAELVKKLKLLFKLRASAIEPLTLDEQNTLMDSEQDNYNLFLFAVGREYEFQKKFAVAASVFSHVNPKTEGYWRNVYWKSGSGKRTIMSDYYDEWFFYLDAEYKAEELQSVIDFAELKFGENRPFDHWQRKYLRKNIDKLYDLLGTKYVRQNNMDKAISAFEKVGGDLWKKHPYRTYLDANPFHADFYSGHKPSELDTIKYTKLEIAILYKSHLQKAESPKTKNRAYYYFLVANCELNMSYYGNSWMMRRYFWTGAMNPNYLEDDDDYFRLKRAREFYQKAFDVSSKKDVKALCLRMLGRCEKHQLYFDAPDSWDFDYDSHGGYRNYFYSMNKSYKKLEKEYPNDAEELLSNCFSFERYFAKMEN